MYIYKKIYNKYFFILNKLRILHLKMLGAKLGKNIKSYGRFTVINASNLEIGDDSTINEGVHINCRDKVIIGKNVRISTNVQIHTGKLIYNTSPRVHSQEPIIIKDNVWIASSSILLAGITVGENSIISAASVVTKDIPSNCLVAGVPAKLIKNIG